MTDLQRQQRNGERLAECHPPFRDAVRRVLRALEADGYRPRIQCAWRSLEQQQLAYAAGRSHLRWGFHNATTPAGHPDALAVDILDDNAPLAPSRRYCLALACVADRFGLQTGVTWGLVPHLKRATQQAIAARAVDAEVKVGFDPCHVEVRGVTVMQAKRGDRPVATMYA